MKMHPLVVNCNSDQFDVLIDRRSKWGNPFILGVDGNRTEVIEKYRKWIISQPKLMAALSELRGKRLGCHCAPNKHCHGEVLAELANAPAGLFQPPRQNCKVRVTRKGASSMSKRGRDDDDDDDDSADVFIQSLSKDRQKLLLARGVPGQDMIPKKTRIAVAESLVKMEPNIPRAMSKIIATGKQLKKLKAILEHPLKSSYTLGIGSFPSDLRAKHMAIMVMNAAIDEYIKKRPPGKGYPLWHRVYGSLGDPLRDRPMSELPCMLIISNVNMESSSIKIEKVRDLLEKYSEIPRIVISGGEPPVDLFANKLHYQMTSGVYIGPSNRIRET